MCQFTGPQGLTRKQSQGIQDHLCEIQSRIEQLSAINVQPQRLGLGQSSTHFVPNTLQPQPRSSAERDRSELQKDFTGNMVVDQHGTQYVDPTHWQAVLNEVSCSIGPIMLQVTSLIEHADFRGQGISPIDGRLILRGKSRRCRNLRPRTSP